VISETNGSTWSDGSPVNPCLHRASPHRYLINGDRVTQTSGGDFQPGAELSLDSVFAPGQLATKDVLDDAERRLRLADVVNRLFNETNVPEYEGARLLKSACVAGKLVIDALPSGSKLPKVATDGDGGLIFAWMSPTRAMLLTLDGAALHFVDYAGSPEAVYYDKLPFSRHSIPTEVSSAILTF